MTYECRCEYALSGPDPISIHWAMSEFGRLADERRDVREAYFLRSGRAELIILGIEARTRGEARGRAESILREIGDAIDARFGEGCARLEGIRIDEAPETPPDLVAQMLDGLHPEAARALISKMDGRAP